MKDKVSLILLISLLFFGLAACGSESENEVDSEDNKKINELSKNIGNTKEEVFKNLNITEGEEVEMFNGDTSLYAFKEEREINGEPFQLLLTFDLETEELYGFMYDHLFADGEDAYHMTKELYEDFNKAYGDPTTYIDSMNRVADLPDYGELQKKEQWNFFETWKKDEVLEVRLEIYDVEDRGNSVVLTYKPNPPEQDYSDE